MSATSTALLLLMLGQPTPLRTPAAVDDAYSLKFNPAGLGFSSESELRLLYTRSNLNPPTGGAGASNGFATYGAMRLFSGLTLGAAIDVEVSDAEQTRYGTLLGLGASAGNLAFGLAWGRNKIQGVDARNRLDAGLSFRARFLGLALGVRDVAQTAERRRWDLGLAVHPIDRLTVSTRWRLTQDLGLDVDTLDLVGLVSAEALEGLTLGVAVGHNQLEDVYVTAQMSLSFGKLAVGASAAAIDGNPTLATELVLRSSPRPSILPATGVAIVDLGGSLVGKSRFKLFPPSVRSSAYGDVPLLLAELRQSDRVRGVFVRIGPSTAGWARAQEARRGLLALRASGRRVDCYLGGSDDLAYYLASACDEIIVSPPSLLQANGLSSEVTFLGEGLLRAGIDVDVVRRGAYKSTPEQFINDAMSGEQREALGAYLDDVFDVYVDEVSASRPFEREQFLELIDVGVHTSSDALARKMVDRVMYPDAIEDHLKETYGQSIRFFGASEAVGEPRPVWGNPPAIAVIHVDQTITGGSSNDNPFMSTVGSTTLIESLERALRDPDIRGVVLRVDSPGGDALASDLIARAVQRLAEAKPVAASFGNVAASGGYYVAAPARVIFAEQSTLTGSIGVFTMQVSVEELLARLGIYTSELHRGERAGSNSWLQMTNPSDLSVAEKVVDHFYDQFLEVVARGRKLDKEKVRTLAEGRIWSGTDAQANGLVDHLGGLTEALTWVRTEAGFDPDDRVRVLTLPANRMGLAPALRNQRDVAWGDRALVALRPSVEPSPWMQLLPSWARPWLALGAHPGPLALTPWSLKVD